MNEKPDFVHRCLCQYYGLVKSINKNKHISEVSADTVFPDVHEFVQS